MIRQNLDIRSISNFIFDNTYNTYDYTTTTLDAINKKVQSFAYYFFYLVYQYYDDDSATQTLQYSKALYARANMYEMSRSALGPDRLGYHINSYYGRKISDADLRSVRKKAIELGWNNIDINTTFCMIGKCVGVTIRIAESFFAKKPFHLDLFIKDFFVSYTSEPQDILIQSIQGNLESIKEGHSAATEIREQVKCTLQRLGCSDTSILSNNIETMALNALLPLTFCGLELKEAPQALTVSDRENFSHWLNDLKKNVYLLFMRAPAGSLIGHVTLIIRNETQTYFIDTELGALDLNIEKNQHRFFQLFTKGPYKSMNQLCSVPIAPQEAI